MRYHIKCDGVAGDVVDSGRRDTPSSVIEVAGDVIDSGR